MAPPSNVFSDEREVSPSQPPTEINWLANPYANIDKNLEKKKKKLEIRHAKLVGLRETVAKDKIKLEEGQREAILMIEDVYQQLEFVKKLREEILKSTAEYERAVKQSKVGSRKKESEMQKDVISRVFGYTAVLACIAKKGLGQRLVLDSVITEKEFGTLTTLYNVISIQNHYDGDDTRNDQLSSTIFCVLSGTSAEVTPGLTGYYAKKLLTTIISSETYKLFKESQSSEPLSSEHSEAKVDEAEAPASVVNNDGSEDKRVGGNGKGSKPNTEGESSPIEVVSRESAGINHGAMAGESMEENCSEFVASQDSSAVTHDDQEKKAEVSPTHSEELKDRPRKTSKRNGKRNKNAESAKPERVNESMPKEDQVQNAKCETDLPKPDNHVGHVNDPTKSSWVRMRPEELVNGTLTSVLNEKMADEASKNHAESNSTASHPRNGKLVEIMLISSLTFLQIVNVDVAGPITTAALIVAIELDDRIVAIKF
ncbi:hypothetical protein QR680_001834 [Steinernema hermaphroditum]|uniref:Caprin-1 dimerization domain-containing protein n=1 Tax=Steinernema hermaphroditum TaxID=289476 RepID=A0AA39H035_9BILA|nr:hypothetical protein QR680_001834 [Steinernema hermaphroditum]